MNTPTTPGYYLGKDMNIPHSLLKSFGYTGIPKCAFVTKKINILRELYKFKGGEHLANDVLHMIAGLYEYEMTEDDVCKLFKSYICDFGATKVEVRVSDSVLWLAYNFREGKYEQTFIRRR